MLAELQIQADTGRYGESLTEATSPDAAPENYASGWGYVVHGPFTNQAERLVGEARDEYRRNLPEGESMPEGLFWTLSKTTYTPILEGEIVEVQREQAAYGSTSASTGGETPDSRHGGED